MKLAKKVLSVVLAVAIALGAFAVAASANGNPDTARYQIKIWLAGSTGTLDWTGNSRVTIKETSDPAEGTITANPGDTVFVYLYATNNYYTQLFQTNVFHSAELLDAQQVYFADENVTSSTFGTTAVKKVYLWNNNNTWISTVTTSASAQTPWAGIASAAQYNIAENWPTADGDLTTSLIDTSKYHWTRITNIVSDQYTDTTSYLEDDGEHLIKFPLTIPADAAPGSTYTVFIPEGIERRDGKPAGAMYVNEIGIADGESEPCDYVDTQAATNPNMRYDNENQYFDLSGATLTIQIPGSTEPEVNYDELNAKLTEALGLLANDITADSKDALNTAITAGNEALSAEDQETVNNAVAALTEAIANVEYLADFAELNQAIARYEELDAADWDATSFAAATEKYNAAKAIDQTNTADQDAVDAAAAALNEAINNLAAALDYSALEAKYNELADKDVANYTDDTVTRFNTALATAKALIDNKNAADQDEINAAYNELVAADAALALKDADYSALETAKGKFTDLTASEWTTASYEAAKAKYDEALEVPAGLKITDQAIIDNAAEALEQAITDLVPAGEANYEDLKAAIAAAKALVADHYTTDSWSAIATALEAAEAVDPNLTANDQDIIDKAAQDLNDAIANKVEADADYSAVNTAITAAQAKIAETDEGTLRYSDEYIAAVNAAIDDVVEGLKKKDQDTVDGYADAINALLDAPVYRPYDYTAINDHIAAIEANPVDYYNAESYAAYLAKKEALVLDYTHKDYAKAKLQQIQFLKVTVAAAGPADYADVEAAIGEFEAKIAAANYTEDSIKAVRDVIATVDYTLNENAQTTVDGYAAAIREATSKLVEIEYADYDAFNGALADAKAVDAKLYTAASYAAFIDAVDEIDAGLAKDLLAADQEIVDNATAAIAEAYSILKLAADYSVLEAAILKAGTYDENVWTAETWAEVEKALAAAEEVPADLSADEQDLINDAAEAIETALGNLKAKEVVSNISTINWTPSEDTHNTFTVAVNGRPAMIQFIEMDGGTRTYDRYNQNVTIKSYDAQGNEVNSLDRSVAYEVWEIYTNLIGPDVKARAKYLEGRQYIWEQETYNFTVETLEPVVDADVRSITPAATSGKKGGIATTVVVGPDAQGIQFRMDNGTTTTYYADKATVLDNGDLEFTGKAWMNNDGLNVVAVYVRVNNTWVEAGSVEYTVE